MKRMFTRLVSCVLCGMMLVESVPANVYAAGTETYTEESVYEEEQVETQEESSAEEEVQEENAGGEESLFEDSKKKEESISENNEELEIIETEEAEYESEEKEILKALESSNSSIWDGSVAHDFAGGNGTLNDPYLISCGQQLEYFRQAVVAGESFSGKYIQLSNDIYLNDIADYKEWSDSNHPQNIWKGIDGFRGTLDGNSKTIYGLYMKNDGDNTGLFNSLLEEEKVIIKNLNIAKAYISGENNVAAIVGNGLWLNISNCSVEGIVKGTGDYVGGFVGKTGSQGLFGTVITESKNYANVTGNNYVAGFLGYGYIGNSGGNVGNAAETITVDNLYNYGDVLGNDCVGGIAGSIGRNLNCGGVTGKKLENKGNIRGNNNCGGIFGQVDIMYKRCRFAEMSNRGEVNGASKVGGLIGKHVESWTYSGSQETTYIENSYNWGNIYGESEVAGLVGYLNITWYVIVELYHCYNAGNIDGNDYIDTLVGDLKVGVNSACNAIACYYKANDGVTSVIEATTFTENDKGNVRIFSQFDFIGVWKMTETYPVLRWQEEKEVDTLVINKIPYDAHEYNGHYYYAYNIDLDWDEAKEYCESLGGHLATITSKEENDFVYSISCALQDKNYWLGAADAEKEGEWVWITGEPWGYTNWAEGQPDNMAKIEHYLQMWWCEGSGEWNDTTIYNKDNINGAKEEGGFVCEWDKNVGKQKPFDPIIYRADLLLNNLDVESISVRKEISSPTPSKCFVEQAQEGKLEYAIHTWEMVTLLGDSLDKGSKFYEFGVKEKDIYWAVILSMLEASTDYGIVDEYEDAMKDSKQFVSVINDLLKTECNIDLATSESWRKLSREERVKAKEKIEKKYKEEYQSDIASIDKVFRTFDEITDIADCLETCVEKISSTVALYSMADEMKKVVHTMQERCPASNTNMKSALDDCVRIIDSSTDELAMRVVQDTYKIAGTEIIKKLFDELFWKPAKEMAFAEAPWLEAWMAAYKTSKYISNLLFSPDSIVEKYCYMKAVIEVENLLEDVFYTLEKQYEETGSKEMAAAYLSAVDAIYNSKDYDCKKAYAFTDAADESLCGKVGKLLGTENAKERDSIKKTINSMQRIYNEHHENFLTLWYNNLLTDYPNSGLYKYYEARFEERLRHKGLTKKIDVACPVDVYVYDAQNNLIASVVDNKPFCLGNMTVVVRGDRKELYFYDNDEYHIEYIGNGNGSMDCIVTEYGSDEVPLRNVYFYDVPLTEGKTYESDLDEERPEESYLLREDGGEEIVPDLDTCNPKNDKYRVSIFSGTMDLNGELFFETEAYPGEQINVHAIIPNEYEFAGWSSNVGTDIFYDVDARDTTVKMPEADVEVIAMLRHIGSREDYLRAPLATIESGSEVDSGTKVTLISCIDGAKIYYTLDGTDPTKESPLFVEPIEITSSVTIKAFVAKEGCIDSDVAIFIYTIKGADEKLDDSDTVLPEDIPTGGEIPDDLWIAGIDETGYIYTGSAIKPSVRVYDGRKRLKENTDYTISYTRNTAAYSLGDGDEGFDARKAPTLIVKGKGNYKGTENAVFKIVPKNIGDEDITAESIEKQYTGKKQTPLPAVKWNGKTLKNRTDYEALYPDTSDDAYKKPGTYEILVKGKGNYTGEKRVAFSITGDKLLSKATVSRIADKTYTGEDITLAKEDKFVVKHGATTLTENEHYTLSYRDNREIGTASVIITAKPGSGYFGQKTATFRIIGGNMKDASVSGITAKTYAGKAVTQNALSLKIKRGNQTIDLTEGQDYTVSYRKNENAGTAEIQFTGINGYTGVLKKTFKIGCYSMDAVPGSLVKTEENLSAAYEKGGSRIKPTVKFDGQTLVEGRDYTLSYKNNAAANDGSDAKKMPTVTIKGRGNFTGSRTLDYVITRQDIQVLTLSVSDKVYANKKNAYKSAVKVIDLNGKALSAGTDYEKEVGYYYGEDITLDNGTARSKGQQIESSDILPKGALVEVRVKGKGNYDGTLTGTYRIVSTDIGKASVKVEAQTYTGKPVEPSKEKITVKLGKDVLGDKDYEIAGYSNNIKAGTAKITIRGVGNYGNTKTASFTIGQKGFLWWWKKLFS